MCDVLIVGAGPAGSIAATLLARAGARVLVLERARFPRHKLCGDTVNPGALAILRRLGLDSATAGGLDIQGMVVTGEGGVRVMGTYGAGVYGRALMRRELDAALVAAAAAAGARIDEGVLVEGPVMDGGAVVGVRVRGRDTDAVRITAPVVIAADGRHSRIARALSLSRYASHPRRWAVGAYFEGVARSDAAVGEMHVRRGHYIGVAPLPGGITNACLVTAPTAALRDPSALLIETIAAEPALAGRFAGACLVAPAVSMGPLAVDSVAPGTDGLLLAGDAAGFIDPMTGDGLRFAFRGSELAAEEALRALEHGWNGAHRRLAARRRVAFRAKWRFNRMLRALVSAPVAIRVAGAGAAAAPGILRRVIAYAGDVA